MANLWVLAFLGVSVAGHLQPVPYPAVPGLSSSAAYQVTVDGVTIPVQRYGNANIARWTQSGSAQVRVRVSQSVSRYTLSPRRVAPSASVSGADLTFSMAQAARLVLRQVNSLPDELFLFADAPEVNPPTAGASGVINALDYGADRTGATLTARRIQQAIDTASGRAGGGTVLIPAGLYLMETTLWMRSNVNVYLAPGAVLQVPPREDAYPGNQIIGFYDVTNARLTGRGVIYGTGAQQSGGRIYTHGIHTENAQSSSVEEVMVLDPAITGMRIVDARQFTVRRAIILADHGGLSDGIDIDSSQDVTIDGAFIYSSDDNTSLGGGTGVRKTIKDIERLRVSNCIMYQTRSGSSFKIGTTLPQNWVRNLVYENVDIIQAPQVAAFYPIQGANIDTVLLRNITAETVTQRILEFSIVVPNWETWNGRLGYIHNITLQNVSVDDPGPHRSVLRGFDTERNIRDVTFQNVRVGAGVVRHLREARLDLRGAATSPRFFD